MLCHVMACAVLISHNMSDKAHISILVPVDLRAWLDEQARRNRRTLSAEIQVALEQVKEWRETAEAEQAKPW